MGFDFSPNKNWTFRSDFRRLEKEGQTISGGSFLFSAAQLARPIDYSTDELEMSLAYDAQTWQVSLGYFGSLFDNGDESLTWDNPYAQVVPGDDRGQISLSPDNEFHQMSVSGSMLLPARTVVNGRLALGRMTQDETLLPYTINPDIPTAALPADVFDGEVDTTSLNLRAVSSPLADLTVQGEVRYDERDNDSPEQTYDYVITDQLLSEKTASNIGYDYERRDLKLNATYRMSSRIRIQGGYDNERFERNRQARSRTTTDRLWGRLDSSWMGVADLDLELFIEDRGGSSYEEDPEAFAPQNPLMRKYNLADRDRTGIKLYGSVYAFEQADIGLDVEYSEDEYDSTDIGLLEAEYLRLGLDFTWLITDTATAYGAIYREEFESRQQGSQTFSTPDWQGATDDIFNTATVGLRYPELIGPLDAFLEYTYADSEGEIASDTSGLTDQFPDLETTRHSFRLGLDYPWSDRLSLRLQYLYEDFDSADWALEGVNADTVPNLLSLGADPFDYDVSVFYLSARWAL